MQFPIELGSTEKTLLSQSKLSSSLPFANHYVGP
jgi:hypothetical protein